MVSDIPAGDRKLVNLFLRCRESPTPLIVDIESHRLCIVDTGSRLMNYFHQTFHLKNAGSHLLCALLMGRVADSPYPRGAESHPYGELIFCFSVEDPGSVAF